jgi:hypothetical protein
MQLETFIERFQEIKQKGFVPSLRRGPTGVGYTLETLIGISENNLVSPDLGTLELKAHRVKTNSLITLFTFNRKAWQIPPLTAIKKYGSQDASGRLGMYYTLGLKPNSAGLFVHVTDENVTVRHIDGTIIAVWNLQQLTQRFVEKIPALMFVSAFSEERDGLEYFHYYRAQLLEETTSDVLLNQFKQENIVLDLRLHDKGTSARNHGTGFRVNENHLPLLFKSVRDVV